MPQAGNLSRSRGLRNAYFLRISFLVSCFDSMGDAHTYKSYKNRTKVATAWYLKGSYLKNKLRNKNVGPKKILAGTMLALRMR